MPGATTFTKFEYEVLMHLSLIAARAIQNTSLLVKMSGVDGAAVEATIERNALMMLKERLRGLGADPNAIEDLHLP